MLRGWLKRYADKTVSRANDRLEQSNQELQSRLRLQQLEIDELAAVVARNQRRVEAETAIAARRIADAEGQQHVTSY